MTAFAPSTFRGLMLKSATRPVCETKDRSRHVEMSLGQLSRRDLLRTGLSAAILSKIPLNPLDVAPAKADDGPFDLPPLPYAYDALEPAIDELTMRTHHDKHFNTYRTKLNAGLAKLGDSSIADDASLAMLLGQISKMSTIDELTLKMDNRYFEAYAEKVNAILEKLGDSSLTKRFGQLTDMSDASLRMTLRNNGGGYLNHKLFFEAMCSPSKSSESGAAVDAIKAQYGTLDAFKEQFTAACLGLFGSGFIYLVKTPGGKLEIRTYKNQDNPVMDNDGCVALVGLDMWEHGYYLNYKNDKASYIKNWWSIVDWGVVAKRYSA